jgi:hypothetical protein
MQKTRVGEKNLAIENTWYETFKAGGESTVQAWKQYLSTKTTESEYEDSAVLELRNTALIPILYDELESISAYGVNGSRVKKKNRRSKKQDEFGVGDDDLGKGVDSEDVEFSVGELVASTSKLAQINKELGLFDG